ncbi:hypothetical protein ACQR1W_31595 [Bradyrhizobium sp. HKCCYLS1011]|uniref:hypothetical protein n=1 Tax=Bradyrhizobium sp. HKCCYLS1011 TaxID=3420733 RepID=UPI003EB6FAD4
MPLPDYGPYPQGSVAAKEAKRVGDLIGCRVQPRRMSQAGDWRERHRRALAEAIELGTLKPLPEKWDLPPIADHFAHIDPINYPGMISFVASEEEGVLDRYTRVTPGRYISRYYEDHKISDSRRRKLIATVDPTGEVQFATTPDEITRVYKTGPESCMDGDHTFSTPVWPTSVYGAGDLAVAYTVNNRGRIQSRAVCWPDKQIFGRCYGDVERLEKALTDEGFETPRDDHSVDGNGATFVGARMLKVFLNGEENYAVMPYFDDLKVCLDAGDHWVTAESEPPVHAKDHPDMVKSGGTNGYAEIQRWCPKMLRYYSKRSFKFVHGVEQHWSAGAIESYAFRCEWSDEYWADEAKYKVTIPDAGRYGGNLYVSKKAFDQDGATCEATNKPCRKSDLVEHEGKMVSRHWARREKERAFREAEFRRPYLGMKADRVWVDEYEQIPVNVTISGPTTLNEISVRELLESRLPEPRNPEPHYVNELMVDGRVIRRRVA